jgi:hypothetical protein
MTALESCERPVIDLEAALALPVTGIGLSPGKLGDQIAPAGTLLVCLRHFACIFCREMVGDLRKLSADAAFPSVLFVCMGNETEAREFFDAHWPGARAVCDPEKRVYEAFGLTQGTPMQMFGPRAWACGLRAVSKGHFIGMKVVGDPWLMPGAFLIQDRKIVWTHEFASAGDRPDWKSLPIAR